MDQPFQPRTVNKDIDRGETENFLIEQYKKNLSFFLKNLCASSFNYVNISMKFLSKKAGIRRLFDENLILNLFL